MRVVRKLRRAVLNPRQTIEQGGVAVDLARTWFRAGRVLRGVRAPEGSPRALVVSLSEWPFQLKLEAFLAKALEAKGFTPVFLTPRNGRFSERYLRALGIRAFCHIEDFATGVANAEIDVFVEAVMSEKLSVQNLKSLQFRGSEVGVHALSTLSRAFQQGRISLDDPAVRDVLSVKLRQAMQTVVAAEQLLTAVEPSIVSFLEKGYTNGPLYDVALARNLNVIQYVHAGTHWRDALMLKRYSADTRRMHPASVSQETWRVVRELEWTPEREASLRAEFEIRYGEGERHPDAGLQEGKQRKTADAVREQLGLAAGRKTAVVFSHVLWDANLFYGDDLFDEMETWLVETVRAACANDAVDWIIKVHPANMIKAERGQELNEIVAIRERIGPLPSHVHLLMPETDINTFSLFEVADWAITIRGTIGMELPCFGVPVLTAGTGRYSGLGFTIDSETASDYLARLAHIQDIPPLDEETVLLAKRHAYAVFCLRACRFFSFESVYRSPMDMRSAIGPALHLRLRHPSQVSDATDLDAYARWASDATALDYLDTELASLLRADQRR